MLFADEARSLFDSIQACTGSFFPARSFLEKTLSGGNKRHVLIDGSARTWRLISCLQAYARVQPAEALDAVSGFSTKSHDIDDQIPLSYLRREECQPEKFGIASLHRTRRPHIRKLSAHGPVLYSQRSGSGKSALMIEAHRRMKDSPDIFSDISKFAFCRTVTSEWQRIHRAFFAISIRRDSEKS